MMCDVCGCDSDKTSAVNMQNGEVTVLDKSVQYHEHVHADGTRHRHVHGHAAHGHTHAHGPVIELETRILAKNDALAERNRAWLGRRGTLAVNLMSAPGAGKTTLLERTIRDAQLAPLIYVIEGDQATANDGERIRAAGAAVVQLNRGTGCHLDADMVAHGFEQLDPPAGAIIIIENVGNLVCPALFDLGERRRVVVFSVTEGEDKPLKYPHMFRAADVVLLSKVDLLPHLDFDVERAIGQTREINPDAALMRVSARTGAGLDAWYAWLRKEAASVSSRPNFTA
jgi:hydrogenase nickel incorporation protein HypB